MILYTLKKYVNEKLSAAYGKFFAYPVITQTYGLDELAEHMESHNTPFSKGAIKGMLTDMVSCVRELVLQGIAVKIPDLAIFSIGIKNKEGAASEKEFSITKNIAGLKLRARGTGEFKANSLNLDVSLKKATAVTGDVTPPDGGKDNTGDTTQAILPRVAVQTRVATQPKLADQATPRAAAPMVATAWSNPLASR